MKKGVTLRGVAKAYGATRVIEGLDLDVNPGEFCVFVGPSGCGKSTILRMIAGLETVSDGDIAIGGRDVTREDASRRGVAMVVQNYALYPHMSVAENMGFALKMAKRPKDEIRARVAEVAETLQVTPYLDRRPADLSGGQRQRVAIGRALVRDPDVFLFDEPLSNLDAALRGQTRVEIARLHDRVGATMIYVTHDQVEAMTLADRIVVFEAGRVRQIGSPMDLYREPANLFVAGFIGSPSMNVLESRAANGQLSVHGVTLDADAPDGPVTLGVRPEDAVLTSPEGAALIGRAVLIERLGGQSIAHLELPDGTLFLTQSQGDTPLREGEAVGIDLARSHRHLFGADGDRIETAPAREAVRA